jgi:hypothetical protein
MPTDSTLWLPATITEADHPDLSEQLQAAVANSDFLSERLADLELALDDVGWERLDWDGSREFTRDFLDRLIALSRLNALKNPLIRRGVALKAGYVWGQGVEIQARDDDVNEQVIQPFLDDRGNRESLFGAQARMAKDRALTTDGAVALVLFPNMLTGAVSVRSIDPCEIRDIVCNPDDHTEPWFYLRRWTERTWGLDGPSAGIDRTRQREAWYPDWRYQPRQRFESIGRMQVRWDSPIYYVKVGGLDGMKFGVPETYAALDWAKAYKLFLEDWATIVRSLSRFAMQLTVKRKPQQAAARLGSSVTRTAPGETNPSPTTGSTFVATEGVDLKAIPKTDATVAAGDGVWLAKMVGAALGLPYTILMGDPDMGNLATAKTLDRPTELTMMERQSLWADVIRDLCGYAIDWAVKAPGGKLAGTVLPDGSVELPAGTTKDRQGAEVEVPGSERRTIDVTFPSIREIDVKETIEAIVMAAGTELPPLDVVLRLLLAALGVEDADEIVADFDEAKWQAKRAEAGAAALERFRNGEDPARAIDPEEDE